MTSDSSQLELLNRHTVHTPHSTETHGRTQTSSWLILRKSNMQNKSTNLNERSLRERPHPHPHLTLACIHSQSEQHVSLRTSPPPTHPSQCFPYLNVHPRHSGEIAPFWHLSTKSSMGAIIKLRERAGHSGPPLTRTVLVYRQQGHVVLLRLLV